MGLHIDRDVKSAWTMVKLVRNLSFDKSMTYISKIGHNKVEQFDISC